MLVAALLGLSVLLVRRGADFMTWYPWQLLGIAAVWTLPALDRAARRRRVRLRVRERLSESAPSPGAPSSGVFSTFERRALVACLSCDAVVLVAGALLAERRPALPAAWALTVVLLAGSLVASLIATLRAPLVGSAEVVPAVDAALRRREVAEVVPLAVVPLLLSVALLGGEPIWTLANGVLGLNVVCLAVAWFLRQDDVLLRDPRLADAPAPEQWLSGAAA